MKVLIFPYHPLAWLILGVLMSLMLVLVMLETPFLCTNPYYSSHSKDS